MNNIEKYNAAIRESFEMDETDEVENVKRGTTGNWDSLGHIVLIDKIETTFDIMISPEDILSFKDYESGIDILKKYDVVMDGR